MAQPLPKALSGLLRGGTTVSDALPKEDMPVFGLNAHEDIGSAGYDSSVFAFSGVMRQAPGGEHPLHDATKRLAMMEVEQERLSRAKLLEERKGKNQNLLKAQMVKEMEATSGFWTGAAVTETAQLPQTVVSWVQSWWKKEEAVCVEKKAPMKRSKNAQLASIASRNAREASARAREEMEKARCCGREAKQTAFEARTIPQNERKLHVLQDEEDIVQKPLSLLRIQLAEGKNFPLIGDSKLLGKVSNPYAKVLFHNPQAESIEPQSFFSTTQYSGVGRAEWLQEFEFQVATDWDDESRPEQLEFIFYHEPKTMTGKSKQDPESDPEFGRYIMCLNDFVKMKPSKRFPDGTTHPAFFDGTLLKWFKLHDSDFNPVQGRNPAEGPPSFQAQITFTDSFHLKNPHVSNARPILLPSRPDFRAPAPKPPKTWTDHPDWAKVHGPGLCTCCGELESTSTGGSRRTGSRSGVSRSGLI